MSKSDFISRKKSPGIFSYLFTPSRFRHYLKILPYNFQSVTTLSNFCIKLKESSNIGLKYSDKKLVKNCSKKDILQILFMEGHN